MALGMGHKLSIICAALNDNNVCYYCGPHQGGAIFVEFYNVLVEVFHPISAKSFLDITTQAIQQFAVEHKIFVTSFLFQNQTPYKWAGDNLIATFKDGQALKISFERIDGHWRIKEINGTI